jgi:hypothetical protein
MSQHGIDVLHLHVEVLVCLLDAHLTMPCMQVYVSSRSRQPQYLAVNENTFFDDERGYFIVLNNAF